MIKISYDINILVNRGLINYGGSHETVFVIYLEGTTNLYLNEVNGMNTVHLYGTACLFCLIDGLHYHLEVTLVWIGNRHAASSSSRLASNDHKILKLACHQDYGVYWFQS